MLKRTRVILLSLSILVICTVTVAAAYQSLIRNVTVIDNNATRNYSTSADLVGDFFTEQNIHLGEYDEVSIALNSNIKDNDIITIKRAIPVDIVIDGLKTNVMTCKNTVEQVLDEKHVVLGEKDKINYFLVNNISANMSIEIQTYQELTITESESIPFTTEKRETEDLQVGEERVIQTGSDGQKVNTYKVIYIGGKETERKLDSETVKKEPVNTIIEVGVAKKPEPIPETIKKEIPSQDKPKQGVVGENKKPYSKVMTLRATAYTPQDGGGNGIAYTGMKARYGVVAVDPDVIPLYSKLYIEGYGEAIAGDTGGDIQGNRIDLCYESYETAMKFGVRNVTVYILE